MGIFMQIEFSKHYEHNLSQNSVHTIGVGYSTTVFSKYTPKLTKQKVEM